MAGKPCGELGMFSDSFCHLVAIYSSVYSCTTVRYLTQVIHSRLSKDSYLPLQSLFPTNLHDGRHIAFIKR